MVVSLVCPAIRCLLLCVCSKVLLDTCMCVRAHTQNLQKRPAGKLQNFRPSGTVSNVTSPAALSASKIYVPGTKNYLQEFEAKNGTAATALVTSLSKRHCMVNPGMSGDT